MKKASYLKLQADFQEWDKVLDHDVLSKYPLPRVSQHDSRIIFFRYPSRECETTVFPVELQELLKERRDNRNTSQSKEHVHTWNRWRSWDKGHDRTSANHDLLTNAVEPGADRLSKLDRFRSELSSFLKKDIPAASLDVPRIKVMYVLQLGMLRFCSLLT